MFELQLRAAQDLMKLMPRVQVGGSLMVERESLIRFLKRIAEAPSPARELAIIRTEKPGLTRRKLRSADTRSFVPLPLDSLPRSITLKRGSISIDFSSRVELVEQLHALTKVIESDEFLSVCVPRELMVRLKDQDDIKAIFEELKQMESEWSRSQR